MKKNTWYDINVTRTLLQKDEKDLTDNEKEAVKHYRDNQELYRKRLHEANEEIQKNCPILCSGFDSYFIPSYGWIEHIKDFCYQLEALNIEYTKYGVKVNSSQNKEKFGTYRCYYDIHRTPKGVFKYPILLCDSVVDRLMDVDFGRKTVIDEHSKVTIEWRDIDKDEFETKKLDTEMYNKENSVVWNENDSFRIVNEVRKWKSLIGLDNQENVETIQYTDENGEVKKVDLDTTNVFKKDGEKYYIAYELHHGPRTHVEFTKNRFLRFVMNRISDLKYFMEKFVRYSKKDEVMVRDFEIKVSNLYRECEDKCQTACEHCGYTIGDKYSPSCMTNGWVSYVCEDCAMTTGDEYVKNGEMWREGVKIKDK